MKLDQSAERFAESRINSDFDGEWPGEQLDLFETSGERNTRKSVKTHTFEAGKNKSYARYVEFEGSRIVRISFRKKRTRNGNGHDITKK